MTSYNDLDLDHKREFLMNQTALFLVISALNQIEGSQDTAALVDQVWKHAHEVTKKLSDERVGEMTADLEAKRKPFNEAAGDVVIQELN